MPIKAVKQFTAWSYSRLSDYEACPRRAQLKHLEKLVEPAGPALERGSAIHKEAEDYVRGRLTTLPDSLARFPTEFQDLREAPGIKCEQQLAVNAGWEPCDWFARDAWLRVVIDCSHDAADGGRVVLDYKTGKVYPEAAAQLDLYGLVVLAHDPTLVRVDAAFWYLDQGEIVARSVMRKEAAKLRKTWAKRAAPLLTDVTFKPRPGNACRWCWFGQGGAAKGGPARCEF